MEDRAEDTEDSRVEEEDVSSPSLVVVSNSGADGRFFFARADGGQGGYGGGDSGCAFLFACASCSSDR